MDEKVSNPASQDDAVSNEKTPIDPSWEKWRNEQVQTISSILSNVFKVEDEVRQCQSPSRLLRNPARQAVGNEKEVCEKLSAIRQQISEYEQMLQLSLKRIDKALEVVQPSDPVPIAPPEEKKPSKRLGLKKWVMSLFRST